MNRPDIRLYSIIKTAIERYPALFDSLGDLTWSHGAHGLWNHCDCCKEMIVNMIVVEKPCVIYSKEFAQAFWFDDDAGIIKASYFPPEEGHPIEQVLKHWQYHQVQLILADNPLEYLESFL